MPGDQERIHSSPRTIYPQPTISTLSIYMPTRNVNNYLDFFPKLGFGFSRVKSRRPEVPGPGNRSRPPVPKGPKVSRLCPTNADSRTIEAATYSCLASCQFPNGFPSPGVAPTGIFAEARQSTNYIGCWFQIVSKLDTDNGYSSRQIETRRWS